MIKIENDDYMDLNEIKCYLLSKGKDYAYNTLYKQLVQRAKVAKRIARIWFVQKSYIDDYYLKE